MYEPFRHPETGLLSWGLSVPSDITPTVRHDKSHGLDLDQKHSSLFSLEVPADHNRGTNCGYVCVLPAFVASLVQSAPRPFC